MHYLPNIHKREKSLCDPSLDINWSMFQWVIIHFYIPSPNICLQICFYFQQSLPETMKHAFWYTGLINCIKNPCTVQNGQILIDDFFLNDVELMDNPWINQDEHWFLWYSWLLFIANILGKPIGNGLWINFLLIKKHNCLCICIVNLCLSIFKVKTH